MRVIQDIELAQISGGNAKETLSTIGAFGGMLCGAAAATVIAIPLAGFGLACGISGNTGKLIPGVFTICVGGAAVAIAGGAVIGGVFSGSVGYFVGSIFDRISSYVYP